MPVLIYFSFTGSENKIYMPFTTSFIDTESCAATEGYYSALLHELTHWTGHPSRINRKIRNEFGDKWYAEEELTAELGAAFLAGEFGIINPSRIHHASYIAVWLEVLKQSKHCVFTAASEASKAVDYLQNLQPLMD